jgi:hypothetical protein
MFLLVHCCKAKVDNSVSMRLFFKGQLRHCLTIHLIQNRLKFLDFPYQLTINLFQVYNLFLDNLFFCIDLFILFILLD